MRSVIAQARSVLSNLEQIEAGRDCDYSALVISASPLPCPVLFASNR
jgi:hypothetical protein